MTTIERAWHKAITQLQKTQAIRRTEEEAARQEAEVGTRRRHRTPQPGNTRLSDGPNAVGPADWLRFAKRKITSPKPPSSS